MRAVGSVGFGGGHPGPALSRLSLKVCEQVGGARGDLKRVSRDLPGKPEWSWGASVLCEGWLV